MTYFVFEIEFDDEKVVRKVFEKYRDAERYFNAARQRGIYEKPIKSKNRVAFVQGTRLWRANVDTVDDAAKLCETGSAEVMDEWHLIYTDGEISFDDLLSSDSQK